MTTTILQSPVDFLDTGSEKLVTGSPIHFFNATCSHPATTSRPFKSRRAVSFFPNAEQYRRSMAALRFKLLPFPKPDPSFGTIFQKYVEPILDLFEREFVPDHSSYPPLYFDHQNVSNRDIVRIYHSGSLLPERVLFAILIFQRSGTICWHGLDSGLINCSACIASLTEWNGFLKQEQPKYILVTDEFKASIVRYIDISALYSVQCVVYDVSSGPNSLRNLVNFLLYQHPSPKFRGSQWYKAIHGALNDQEHARTPVNFHDFDRYTLQRSRPDLIAFLSWKEDVAERFVANPLQPGTSLQVKVNAFAKQEFRWRCQFPSPDIPSHTREYVFRGSRPRSTSIDDILTEPTLRFEITKVIRHKPGAFSQVFFGVLHSGDGRVSSPVCLKLFLGMLLPAKRDVLLEDFEETEDPSYRLEMLHSALDLVCREESAYDRLREYQGSMLPHSYGFHEFILEGEFVAYGALIEIVPDLPIAEVPMSDWSPAIQTEFVQHIRECLRALLYAGVDQGDFHGGQILLPAGPDYCPGRDGVVLIDFAFAIQRLGDEQAHNVAATLLEKGNLVLRNLLEGYGIPSDVIGSRFDSESLDLNEY